MTEERTVEDAVAGSTLFTYHMYPTSQPIMVQKIEEEHWIAVFEKPTKDPVRHVAVEKISENEYRVVFQR